MVITIEPIVNIGMRYSKVDLNGWTARTMDGKLSAQYEHTIAITKDGNHFNEVVIGNERVCKTRTKIVVLKICTCFSINAFQSIKVRYNPSIK